MKYLSHRRFLAAARGGKGCFFLSIIIKKKVADQKYMLKAFLECNYFALRPI